MTDRHLKLVAHVSTNDRDSVPFDNGGGPPHDGDMDIDKRVTTIETLLPTLMTRADGEVLRADLHRLDASIKTWMIATILALFFGFAGLFFTMSNSLKGAPTATQAPVIITIPQAPAPPQAASK